MDPTEWMDVSQYMRPRDDAPAPASAPEPEGLAALVAMGFGRAAAEATLAAHGGDVGAAANALSATAHAARPAASLAAPAAPPPPVANEKAPRPRKVLLAEFEGLGREDASQALRDAGGDLDKARALIRRKREGAPAPPLAPRDSNKRASDASDGEASLECKPKKKAKPAPAPRPLDGATSPYNMALRDAVDAAVAAVAADGEPLFEEAAHAALHKVAALDADARHVLARLLFVKGPWHPVHGSRASLDSYAGGDAATVRAALEGAGALVVLRESSSLADASEALPTLVADEVKRVVAALKESAPDAWKAAKKQYKGSTKDAHVAVARAVAATLEDATALAFLVADEKALVRIDRGVETALLRALRFAERRGGFLSSAGRRRRRAGYRPCCSRPTCGRPSPRRQLERPCSGRAATSSARRAWRGSRTPRASPRPSPTATSGARRSLSSSRSTSAATRRRGSRRSTRSGGRARSRGPRTPSASSMTARRPYRGRSAPSRTSARPSRR